MIVLSPSTPKLTKEQRFELCRYIGCKCSKSSNPLSKIFGKGGIAIGSECHRTSAIDCKP